MTGTLKETYARDQRVWDSCAKTYEDRIVCGHPDVTAYECFEEDFLDRVVLYLARELGKRMHIYDVGCGSGRLHLRYAMKSTDTALLNSRDAETVHGLRRLNPSYAFEPALAVHIDSVGGIDFSASMLDLARAKLYESGLGCFVGDKLRLKQGSAFDLQPMPTEPLPVVVSVCNSVGVMQGPEGAMELYKSVRRAVETAGGIGIISGYRQEAVGTFALGNYESTMDVCGQPRWLSPDTYASARYRQVPRRYKRAYDPDPRVVVDVFDPEGNLVQAGHVLIRDETRVRQTVETGHIRTHTDYESHWYPFSLVDEWINEHWPAGCSYHLAGVDIDVLRGEPAQLSILDPRGLLKPLLARWKLA